MVEVIAATGGALLTACFVSVGSISYRGRQSRDDLVRNTTAIELLTDKIDDMQDNMKEIFHRLKEVELAVAEIKPRR
jgi:hypothetical protein|tara:strand:+ start:1150 stop:1380 length:231 start_codon:yes stop_codon:yes gene_type:complete